jgi:hypothetical protein
LRLCVLSLILVIGVSTGVEAGSVTLRWDPNGEPDVTGYLLNVGTAPGVYAQRINVGNVTSWTFATLDESVTHYFAVQAFNAAGLQSSLSAEVVLPARPATNVDFGTDGADDILWQHTDGRLAVWNMNQAHLASASLLTPGQVSDPDWLIAGTCDLNADGRPDIVWQHRTAGWIGLWFMQGTQLLSAALFNPMIVKDPRWRIVACADFNRDGRPDLLWQHDTGLIAAWLMAGTTLQTAVLLSPSQVPPDTWQVVGTGDLNADGHTDILWQRKDGWVATWLMNDTVLRTAVLLTPALVAPEWRIRGVADLNQDGRPDLLWQHDNGTVSVWFMDGATMVGGVLLDPPQVSAGWQIVGPK